MPTLPQNPTPLDIGRLSYYTNCMPCHGDQGQGLTDAWRETWESDHQNCWARGCHSGRPGDEGFPLPHDIPPLAGVSRALSRFSSPAALHDYLQEAHPPQRPGALPEEDYWALTAYLLAKNEELPNGTAPGSQPALQRRYIATGTLITVVLFVLILLVARSRR